MPVGGETWGSSDRYVGLEGRVFLVDDADLRPLQYGKTRLVEELAALGVESTTPMEALMLLDELRNKAREITGGKKG